jgi:predicted porin
MKGMGRIAYVVTAASLSCGAVFFNPVAHADDDAPDPPGVTLYGIVDLAVASTHISGGPGTHTGLLTGGSTDSLWGLKGREDMGNGWQARFQLESGFDAANGSSDDPNRLFDYQAWVGLGSAHAGEFRLGRQYTIGQQFGSELEQGSWKDIGLGVTFRASDNFQFSNVVNYLSPDYDGFKFGLGYSFAADDDQAFRTNDNNRAYSAGLKYEQGPWLAIATYDQVALADNQPVQARPRTVQLGGAYDFDVAVVALGWTRMMDGYSSLNSADPDGPIPGLGPAAFVNGGHVDAWYAGVTVPVGASTRLIAQYSYAQPSWSWDDGRRARNAQVATLGVMHDLSKRTSVFAFVGYAGNYNLDGDFVRDNSHTSRVAAGIQHRF